MEGQLLRTPNGATAQVFLNGNQLGRLLDLYGTGKQVGKLQNLGIRQLPAGPLDVAIGYNLPSGRGEKIFGLDRLKLIREEDGQGKNKRNYHPEFILKLLYSDYP